ncbi:ABC-2 family transporter protein [Clostridium saccharobutylicum]|uniref:hypothetical protein n=1 Tax=Clostridium saccharobutylicum TaxID=169679 RepID=UPI000983E1B2|nr:hypothetical protein [Clostridium saccharobutylicum]AQS11338.1 ABC-2 family transporter protein [Clostridium saccharobutylicum]MBC2437124.1 hypothetical protein [Clostridium saccharobutylicum]NSB88733.1 hypothetical protein [Clostridium saccharobutylicum]NYC30689.1 hypothetical protein [Clostridium saccharobutylicum]OOM15428.1 ABC-2 family transporter protein [Clostridium saccharobutylicum]
MINSLTKLEFKKIISNKAVKVVCVLAVIYIILALGDSINSEICWKQNSSETAERLHGIDAIKEKKAEVQKVKGYLDDKKIKEVINYYQELKNNNKDNMERDGVFKDIIIAKYWQPYLGIQNLFGIAYSDVHIFDDSIIDKLTPDSSKEFYSNRIKKINDYLNLDYESPQFDEADANEIIKESKNLTEPMYYEYADGWIRLIDNFFSLNVVIIFILCFSVCNVFTEDIQNGMILVVLPTINGKTKLAFSKIKASIIFAGITYLILNLLFAALLFSFYGFSGWNCPIQIKSLYWLSIYNIKFYEAYILAIVIGLSACLFMVMITLLSGTILKKAFLTMSVVSTFLLAPLLIDTEPLSKIPANLIELLPIKAINYSHTLIKQSMYNVFGIEILRGYITPIILLIAGIAIIPLIVTIYNKQQA